MINIHATLPHDPTAPAEARARASILGETLGDEVAGDVGRLASELVANGVRFGDEGDGIRLRLELDEHRIRVAVTDGERPARRLMFGPPSLETTLARTIVEQLSGQWGVERARDGWTVWADVDADHAAGAGAGLGTEEYGNDPA